MAARSPFRPYYIVGILNLIVAALVIFGATLDAPTSSTSATAPNTPAAPAPATASDAAPAAPEPPAAPAPNPALEQLTALPVKGRAPKTGYERKQFGQAWSDDVTVEFGHNGCDTRNDILRRDLVDITLKENTHDCVVLTGTLHDPYSGTDISFQRGQGTSELVQIDHIVPLADAWQKGAQEWSPEKRRDFANDPRNLLAVDGPLNQQKSAGDAATWLPPSKEYRCTYAQKIIEVKATYGLWVTQAEYDALATQLATCP
ncbi:HNH endonuclease family protein [Corynebacterium striatum]|uniref:HNH endonuclease family protein n=1 Tax=Corynebacterium striatum TaxID=43770 RepID=UPI001A327CAB|nr:HNH endonuclease [Corynebacterium striatum]HAT6582340.1 HNH endonuclease [Corynebacterium striatum]